MLRTYAFTGFPWALLGYVWLDTPVAHWAAVLGPHGLTLVTALLAAGLATLARPGRRALRGGITLAALALLAAAGPRLTPDLTTPEDAPVVRLVQPNAAQHLKWRRDMIPVFWERKLDATAAAPRPDLVVWPEVSVPWLLENAGPALAVIAEEAGGAPVVVGLQRRDDRGRVYNSLALIDAEGQVADLYDKHHLVPFGEYMPAGWIFRRLGIRALAALDVAGYTPGPGPRLIDAGPLGRALPLICYEAIFPQDVSAAPARPDWLLQITNDAWFGKILGPHQHLAQARMRAVEQGLPMVRVANTGVSAMIDARGRVTGALPLDTSGHADLRLPPAAPPTLYSRTGDLPMLALFLALGLAAAAARAPHRQP